MDSIKEIKSIELSSFTTMYTGISVIFSVIAAIIFSIAMAAVVPDGAGLAIYFIPTLIVGTLVIAIYTAFSSGLIYNFLSKKLNAVAVAIKDDSEIVKISTTETAMMIAVITTVQIILLYLVSVLLLPMLLGSMVQTLMLSGQAAVAYTLYQLMMVLSQPVTILIGIFGTFIITFVFTLIGCYIYNAMANRGRGISVKLSDEDKLTSVDSFNPLKLAVMFAVISGVLNIILGIISLISGAPALNVLANIVTGFIMGFVEFYLIGVFYNFLAPKIGTVKLKLIGL